MEGPDPRLLPSILRGIEAARDVMAHEGTTAWGWVFHSSDALTFVREPVPAGSGR